LPKEEVFFVFHGVCQSQLALRYLLPVFQVFDSENSRLRSENNLLKDQLQRSLKELKQFQLRYPSPYAAQLEADNAQDEGNPSLTASPEITSALLTAYDTRKAFLRTLIIIVGFIDFMTYCNCRDIRA
jgi:hypothetical protein